MMNHCIDMICHKCGWFWDSRGGEGCFIDMATTNFEYRKVHDIDGTAECLQCKKKKGGE